MWHIFVAIFILNERVGSESFQYNSFEAMSMYAHFKLTINTKKYFACQKYFCSTTLGSSWFNAVRNFQNSLFPKYLKRKNQIFFRTNFLSQTILTTCEFLQERNPPLVTTNHMMKMLTALNQLDPNTLYIPLFCKYKKISGLMPCHFPVGLMPCHFPVGLMPCHFVQSQNIWLRFQ